MSEFDLQMIKSIKISEETHSELLKLGAKSETFDDIIKEGA
jgi:predicted CopG family antitoxin